MTSEIDSNGQENRKIQVRVQGGSSETVYGLGLIGAWIYFIRRANTPEEKFKGFLKGLAWPAYLVYALFKFLEQE